MEIPEVTSEIRESFRKFAEETTGGKVEDLHIKSILINDRSHRRLGLVLITVGKILHPKMSDTPGEPVLAIFKSDEYLVVTPNRGGLRGMPYLFGADEVVSVETEQDQL